MQLQSTNEITSGYTPTESKLIAIDTDGQLGRSECVFIFRNWTLGKRLASALPRFALSEPREITVQDAPPEAVERFEKEAKKLKLDKMIEQCTIMARVLGQSVFATLHRTKSVDESLTYKDLQDIDELHPDFRFVAYDTLNTAGIVIDQDPLSFSFLKPTSIKVGGKTFDKSRATIIMNGIPMYIDWTPSTFSFGGVSIYQNMTTLIHTYVRGVVSLRRMATKGSSVVFKGSEGGKLTGVKVDASKYALQQIAQMENTGACQIGKSDDVSFFTMTGVSEVDTILKSIEHEIMLALDDTPSAILLDKELSNGLSEGSEDMKAVMIAVQAFREKMIAPLYAFADPYIMKRAWTDEFIKGVQITSPEKYAKLSCQQVRDIWQASFNYEWGNLYPEPESVKEQTNAVKLNNLAILKQLGADSADVEAEINEAQIFSNDIELTEPDDFSGNSEKTEQENEDYE